MTSTTWMSVVHRMLLLAFSLVSTAAAADAEQYLLHEFHRVPLTETYFSEGVSIGDINQDGITDVVHGPYWFAGPGYETSQEIYPPVAQPRDFYADNFFSWVYDFDGDQRNDVLVVGFPGTPAYVYRNPGPEGFNQHWSKHEVFDWVSNESPHFVQLVGDARPELVCTRDGQFGYAAPDWDRPLGQWTFHAISGDVAAKRFGHGLGVGDIDGDGRADILTKDGWFAQPAELAGDPHWEFHPVSFARAGGAEMHAYDVDGDGDNDVITSLAAHEFGLAWYEQLRDGEQRVFRQHLIMGAQPEENRYGIVFSELHTVQLADMDGDGLKDIVTGKTYWSHHRKSPMWDAGAVVYWFRLVRQPSGVDWVPYRADDQAGVGRQLVVGDVNNDQLPDIVVGGMKGCHLLRHQITSVDRARWENEQPRAVVPLANGLSPEKAAQQMTAPPGFQVTLAAGEPQIHQPIALALDARGRVWVAEAYTYPQRAAEGEGQDKIVILEDTDQNGTLDKRTEFATGLNLVSGLEVGFGGVWVGAAPYLLFIPDQDGDDRPDAEPQVVLDGFGYQDTHETLNAFVWGPDGWLYGCHGVFTHSLVGRPGTPDEDRVPLNAGIWRFHPVSLEFEVFAWGTSNPWGVDFNDHGQAFCTACVIPHLYHVIQGARYQRQAGSHFNPYDFDDIKTIADHVHYAGNIREHAWWGHEPEIPSDTLQAGGGHAHCGGMIYLGDRWPAAYRDQLFFNNIHGNRVNRDILERRGSGYVGRHGPDLLLANDRWFRGINLRSGPDGGVYLIDWYDPNACHRREPEIWDRSNGRIYKLTYVGDKSSSDLHTPEIEDVSRLTTGQLAALQLHGNDWYVRTARRLLQERGADPETREQLSAMLEQAPTTAQRLRALWALHAVEGLTENTIDALLGDADEYLRAWTIQLALQGRAASANLIERLTRLAESDSSPVVRLYLASALQRLSEPQRWQVAEALAGHAEDAEDHNLPLMYWYGIEPLVESDPARALRLARRTGLTLLRRFITRRAASDGRGLEQVVAWLGDATQQDARDLILRELLAAFEGRVDIQMPKGWPTTYQALLDSRHPEIVDLADQLAVVFGDRQIFARLRRQLNDPDVSLPRRQQALRTLVRGRDPEAGPALQRALAQPHVRGEALRALAGLDDPQTPAEILRYFDRYSESEQGDAVSTLVSRPVYATALLEAIAEGQVPRTALHAYHIRQMTRFNQPGLRERIEQVWGSVRETSGDKQATVARLKSQLSRRVLAAADRGRGRDLFNKHCASCHKLFGAGEQVGPDITGSNRTNLDYLLSNIVDPSAVLGNDYRMTVLATTDGRVLSGLVQKETDSALTLRTINDTVVVPKREVEDRQLSTQSLMPERLLDPLSDQQLYDLIAYLQSPTQVAVRGPDPPLDPGTRRVANAVEGESMSPVSVSEGTVRPQSMQSFKQDRWSGESQLWWTGAQPGSRLQLSVPLEQDGSYTLELVLTRARDYALVQLYLDDQKLGDPIDLYHAPQVITTGVLYYPGLQLTAGDHVLQVELLGANPEAVPAYMFGLDYVRWQAEE